jgi:anaerobic ribonucleoside-triphosphate reductase
MLNKGSDATDVALSIRTGNEEISNWDRTRIVEALLKETNIEDELAIKISLEVEKQVFSANIKTLTASLVRELVNAKLIEYGLEQERLKHDRLGLPLYDVENLITSPNKENSNIPHGPEATNLTLAEVIKKEFALRKVFSKDIGEAHLRGDIHLHDLGFIDRAYCSGQSLEYVKKYGLNLPNALAIAKPAHRAEVLLAHMVKFAAALQCHFAGAIGWDAVNIFFAPYLEGKTEKEIKQLAQMLVFEFSQQAVARGGQSIFTDCNIYWEIPKHFENTRAIGPGGVYTGKTYKDYEKESQQFAWALMDVYHEGDGCGRPFFFPKILIHMTEKFFQTPRHMEFLTHTCEVASKMGSPYFVFDRGATAKISECCRLSFKLTQKDLDDAQYPWKMRYCAFQNVTLNLPRIGYTCKGDKVFDKITKMFNLAIKAHLQKYRFIKKIFSLKNKGPLALLAMNNDGDPYLKIEKASYLIGMVGLNELVKTQCDCEMHQSEKAFKYGLSIISHMKLLTDKVKREHGMHFVLEQSPAEATSHRFARLDLKHYPEKAKDVVLGDSSTNSVYYTNSTQLNSGVAIDPITRVQREGLFHPLIEAGSISNLFIGEHQPSAESLANFVIKVFKNTKNDQITFSPEFTSCLDCFKTSRGLLEACPFCDSKNIEGITRITGYFSKVSGWNKGKVQELKDRAKVEI